MAEYQVGDRVRVTYEGEVVRTDFPQDRYAQLAHMGGSCLYLPDAATVEVIERRKPKVGDTIEGEAAYRALPAGSVLVANDSALIKIKDGWIGDSGTRHSKDAYVADRRTLVFIPES